MKTASLCLSVASLVVLAAVALAAERKECEPKHPSIDLCDLIMLYMIPATDPPHSALSWMTGAGCDSPVEWKTTGTGGGKREGQVIVTIDGKPLRLLKKYVVPAPWNITLIGDRWGIREMHLSSPGGGPTLSDEFDLEDKLRKREILFKPYKWDGRDRASHKEMMYQLEATNKKPAWLQYTFSCGSAGCSGWFNLFLHKSDADKVPNLVDPGTHLED